jgi:beta-glucanase (GH16 family)
VGGPEATGPLAAGWSRRWASAGSRSCYAVPIPARGTWLITFGVGKSAATTLTLRAEGVSGPVRQLADLHHLRRVSMTVPAVAGTLTVNLEPVSGPVTVTSVTLTLARRETTPPRTIFADDFDGRRLDHARWRSETGDHGWGNRELQNYTASTANLAVTAGRLFITARRGSAPGSFTSGRLNSRFSATYGHVEARVRTSGGAGLLPALWMLGADAPRVDWPRCGEIDIMESLGRREPTTVHATIHGAGPTGRPWQLTTPMATPQPPSEGFHRYTLDWWPNSVQISFDGTAYASFAPEDLAPAHPWLFDKPYYVILNLAVGGDWPGTPSPALPFPQTMQVDYIHWQR